MNLKTYFISVVLFAGLGYGVGRYLQPAEIRIEEKERIKKDVVTIVKEVIKKDGSKEIVTIIEDKTVVDKSKSETVKNAKPQWKVIGVIKNDISHLTNKPDYGIVVERRILGPVFLGAYADTKSNVGVSVGFEF